MLMVGRYPMAILFIDLPAEDIDVNVHPAKAEVRFRAPSQVYSAVQNGVRRALISPHPGSWSPDAGDVVRRQAEGILDRRCLFGVRLGSHFTPVDQAHATGAEDSTPMLTQPSMTEIARALRSCAWWVRLQQLTWWRKDRMVSTSSTSMPPMNGCFSSSSWLSEKPSVPAQALLQPETVHLPPPRARLLNEQLDTLNHLGFQAEPFGPGTFLVRSIPALLSGMDPAAALNVVVEDFEEDETPLQNELEARIIARVCKRAAIKAGQILSVEEQRSLLSRLERCASPRTCPHGRPTMIHLSVSLLERQFGRRGPR